MAEHKHGEMDIKVQEKTFEGFVRATAWAVALIILTLIFIAFINV
ncbi:MAG: aa3-type cytochrome c oxidase subunit IV [Roseovarius sp.]